MPPPLASARPDVCGGGGGTVTDPTSAPFFPRVIEGYCVDPHGDVRAYGEGARGTLDDVCVQQLDGECEVYKAFGLARLVSVRYVDARGSPGVVTVTLSRFAAREGAFGFYTKRVVADGDPAATTLAPLDAGALGALGSGIAYVVRGEHLAELSYTNEAETPEQMRESGRKILPVVSRAVSDHLPGDTAPPPSVALLPAASRLPLGVEVRPRDVLGVPGTGGGALGYYRDGERRYRVAAVVRADADAAGDVLSTLRKAGHATTLKDLVRPAIAVELALGGDAPRVEWVVAQSGPRILGVGDEPLVAASARLTRDEKIALVRKIVGP